MKIKGHCFECWAAPIFLFCVISLLSSVPHAAPTPPGPIGLTDKVHHFLVFGLLATAILRALPSGWSFNRQFCVTVVLTTLLGIIDEIHQSHVPNRDCSLLDILADILGATVAVMSYHWLDFYRTLLEFRPNEAARQAHAFLARKYQLLSDNVKDVMPLMMPGQHPASARLLLR